MRALGPDDFEDDGASFRVRQQMREAKKRTLYYRFSHQPASRLAMWMIVVPVLLALGAIFGIVLVASVFNIEG